MISTMDVRAELSYPAAGPDAVFAMLCDRGYREAVCEATHASRHEISIEARDDGGATVTVMRTLPAQVPDFAKKFVGETIDVTQIEVWQPADAAGSRRADLTFEIKGQPATMRGSVLLEAVGSGAHQVVTGELKVAIPLFGKKLEPEVVKGIVAGLRQEERTGNEWLARG